MHETVRVRVTVTVRVRVTVRGRIRVTVRVRIRVTVTVGSVQVRDRVRYLFQSQLLCVKPDGFRAYLIRRPQTTPLRRIVKCLTTLHRVFFTCRHS